MKLSTMQFPEVKRLCQRLRADQVFVPGQPRPLGIYNRIQFLWLWIYFTVHCKGRVYMYWRRFNPMEQVFRLPRAEQQFVYNTLKDTNIHGWFVVRKFFKSEITDFVLLTFPDTRPTNGKVEFRLTRYSKSGLREGYAQ